MINIKFMYVLNDTLIEEINGITVFGKITINEVKRKKSVDAIPFIVKRKIKK